MADAIPPRPSGRRRADSSVRAGAKRTRPNRSAINPTGQDPGRIIRVWASGGLGTAAFSGVGGGASARASGNISVDRAAVIFRMTGSIEGVDGHVFEDEGPVMAYDIGVHASKLFAGVALNIMGVTGPGRRNLTAIVLSLELGAFGR